MVVMGTGKDVAPMWAEAGDTEGVCRCVMGEGLVDCPPGWGQTTLRGS